MYYNQILKIKVSGIFRRNLGHFIHWLSNTRSSGKQLAEVFHQLKRGLTTTARSSGNGNGLW